MLKEEELYRISLSHEPEEEIKLMISDAMTVANLKKLMCHAKYDPYAKKLTAKKDLVLAAAKMLTHPDLFASFFEALSPPEQALLKEAVFDWGLNAIDLFPRLGLELPEPRYGQYDFGKYPLDFLLDIGYDGGIRISWQLQTILHTALPLPKENWHIQKEIPGGGDYFFSAEEGADFYENLNPLLTLLQDGGYFGLEAAKTVLKGLKNKIAKLHSFAPFVSESDAWPVSTTAKERDRLAGLRLDFILKFLSTALLGKSREIPDPPELPAEPLSFLREKTAAFLSAPSLETDMKYFLPHMSISSKKDFMRRHGKERGKSLNELLPYLQEWPTGDYLLFEDFLRDLRITGMPGPVHPDSNLYCKKTYSDRDYYYGYDNRSYCRSISHYRAMVYEPYFHGLFFMFAALGYFEIAWHFPRESEVKDYYTLGKIDHIKMTELGAAVFGLRDSYSGGTGEEYGKILFHREHPVVQIDPRDRAARIFLEKICDPLGETSFCIDRTKLRKACPDPESLETIFATLTRYAGEELPPYWQEMRRELLRGFVILAPQYEWVVFDLPADNPNLLEVLARSEDRRFVKMEGRRIGMLRKDLNGFKKLLMEAGFGLITP